MNNEITTRTTLKLFVGVLFTSEIRMHMKQSVLWQERSLNVLSSSANFKEVHHLGKDYLGYYLTNEAIYLKELKQVDVEIQKTLGLFCPFLQNENPQIYIFPQLFIA